MYDDEFELTFDLSDEDEASRAPAPEQEPVQEAAPEPAAETEPPVEPVPEPAVPAANGRCVLISGGDRGIGAAAARAFWQAGYRVAVLYHTHAEAAAALEKAEQVIAEQSLVRLALEDQRTLAAALLSEKTETPSDFIEKLSSEYAQRVESR